MRRVVSVLLFGVVALLGAARSAGADDRLVPGEYPTVQVAAAAAAPGDRIVVTGGRHASIAITTPGVTLLGRRGAVVEGTTTVTADGVTVAGFRLWGDVVVQGAGAVVERNELRGAAIRVTGDDATVRRNSLRSTDEGAAFAGISVEGDRADVSRNRLRVAGTGIWVTGAAARVDRNDVSARNPGSDRTGPSVPAVEVDSGDDAADGPRIERNRVRHAGAFGIVERGRGATIARNRLRGRNAPRDSIHVDGAATVVRNRVVHAPGDSPGGNGIVLLGDASVLEGNSVRGTSRDGIQVWRGAGNQVRDCRVRAAGRCGIWVHSGASATQVDGVDVRRCEVGLLNSATGTEVRASDLLRNRRIDVFGRTPFVSFEGNDAGRVSDAPSDDPGFAD